MGLTASIELAFSGLRATQAGMDVVAQNVANAGSAGYTRRIAGAEQQVAGGRTTGVDVQAASRALDAAVQRQLRLEQAGASYTAVKAEAHGALAALFDRPGGTSALPTLLNDFTTALGALATNPASPANRSLVLARAGDLAGSLNGLAGQVADLRQTAETAIGAAVETVNGLLGQVATLNAKVTADPSSAALRDARDTVIDQLSSLVDLKVTESGTGSVTLATTGGLQLFDGVQPTRLSFDAHAPLGPDARYDADPTRRSVGTITATDASGRSRDVLASGLIRSGEIAAQVELRDRVLPAAAAQLDELAAGLAAALSDRTVAGTAAASGGADGFALDLSGLAPGNSLSVTVAGPGGAVRTVLFVRTDSPEAAAAARASGRDVYGLDLSGGAASAAAGIAAALGPGFAVDNPSGGSIRILDDGAAGTTDVRAVSATVTAPGLAGGGPELPLFVDGGRANVPFTGSFEGGRQGAGFAARIAVNPGAVADPASLVAYGPGVAAGDTTRPAFLLDRLTLGTRSFSGAAGIGGSSAPYSGTVADFARRAVETQVADASSASILNDGQNVVLNAVQQRHSEVSGVNIDSELTLLIQLQTAYGANARLLTAAKDMMDMLLRIGA